MKKLAQRSRTTEINAAAIRLFELFTTQPPPSDMFLTETFAMLKAQSDRMTEAIKRSRQISILDEKDAARDKEIRAISAMIQGYLHYPDESVKAAATQAFDVFRKYGLAITRANYASETSWVESLLKDYQTPESQMALMQLPGLQVLIDRLSNAQSEFIAVRVAYEKDLSGLSSEESASNIKPELLDTINSKLVVYLNAMLVANPDGYKEFASAVAQLIQTNNEAVQRRQTKLCFPAVDIPNEVET